MRRRTALVAVSLTVVAVLAWCGWVSGFHRTSGAAEVTWGLSTLTVVAVDVTLWRRRRRAPPPAPWPRPGRGGRGRALVGVAPWLALALVALAWDVLGLDSGPHQYHLTISALSQAYRPLNAAVLLVWMLVGVGYQAARTPMPAPGPTTILGGGTGGFGLVAHAPAAMAPALLLPQSPPAGVAFWLAVPVAAVGVDLVARRSGGRVATAAEFVRCISTARWANVLLIAAWLFAGYHLFSR